MCNPSVLPADKSNRKWSIHLKPLTFGFAFILTFLSWQTLPAQSDLVLTGLIDGPLSGGVPKAIEFYARNPIPDLSIYGFGSATNGGGSDGEEFTFPAGSANAGTFLYVATESNGFNSFFGFTPNYTSSAANINGDDGVELFMNGNVVDVFGDINLNGSGTAWEYLDGWAYRNSGSGPDGVSFVIGNWTFSGPNALDGETSNGTAATPFPIATYTPTSDGDAAPAIAATSPMNGNSGLAVDAGISITFNEDVAATGVWFTISGSSSGAHAAAVSGGPRTFALNPSTEFDTGETVTVTIFAAQITDLDENDPPDNLAADFTFSFSTVVGETGWVINEVHADPADDLPGDANGDGVRSTGDDEFVEIVNNTGGLVDISGWTLSDALNVRHVFPQGTIVKHQCPVVVFGGGSPAGNFGGAIVQTASSGQLGLNNTGDELLLSSGASHIASLTYGSEAGNNQSIVRDPDVTGEEPLVLHSEVAGADSALFSPGRMIDGSLFPGCSLTHEIFDIQGAGLNSPFAGQIMTTENNIVTALAPNGFFMQTPPARSDGNPGTSDGIFVFTATPPPVAVGDLVDVTAAVQEFFGMTELSNVQSPLIKSSGNALPPPIQLDSATPSPNQPQPVNEFERFEGMLVEIASGVVSGSNLKFASDPIAEVFIVAGDRRALREPGILFPGRQGLPVWDGNPEVFELDADKLLSANPVIPAGSTFRAAGVMSFEFGDYEIWPTDFSFEAATLPKPVRPRTAGEITIGTLNMLRLFEGESDFQGRLNKFSRYIREVMNGPDILAVQEVQNISTLQALVDKIRSDDGSLNYTAYLAEGNDISDIDVGFLVRNILLVTSVTQLRRREIVPPDIFPIHDRPPLLLEAIVPGDSTIKVMNLHMRSLVGIDSGDSTRVRAKRLAQSISIAELVDSLQTADPAANLVVTGDFNAFQFTDGYMDVIGQIRGVPADASQALFPGTDIVDPDLYNEVERLPIEQQYSYNFDGTAQAFDHMLTSAALHSQVTGIEYARGNSDAALIFEDDFSSPLRCSDHDGLVLFVDLIPPHFSVNAPVQIWPPDQGYREFEVADLVASLNDLTIADIYFTSASSDEPDSTGAGDLPDDIIFPNCHTVMLRAERDDTGNGRVYTLNLAARDRGGNLATGSIQVRVPVEQSGSAVNDGGAHEVSSGCTGPDVETSVDANELAPGNLPEAFGLEQNYPNPFNPETVIRYHLPEASHVVIQVFNILGQEIARLVDGRVAAGSHEVSWRGLDDTGRPASNGIYLYKLTAGNFTKVRKMTLLR